MKFSAIAFTATGNTLIKKIEQLLDEDFSIYKKEEQPIKEWLKKEFIKSDALIFVGAVAIAVRLIAPLLEKKDTDPAVIVIDEKGTFVISLLSGHIGGGNELTHKVATLIDAIPVVTTATDIHGKFAVDVWSTKLNCVIDNIENIKFISSQILKGKQVAFKSDFKGYGQLPEELFFADISDIGVYVSLNINKHPFEKTLKIMPKILSLGVGCRKNTPSNIFEEFILETLKKENLSIKAVKNIASIDIKKDENCIIDFKNKYKKDFLTFTKKELNTIKGSFTPSPFVKSITGVDNVCERSAVLASGGELILKKTAKNGMTIAIAKSKWEYSF